MAETKQMLQVACDALSEKKAMDLQVLDISQISTIADYFVITNGDNSNQVRAMVDNVQEKMYKAGYACHSVEGLRSANWVLLDYGDVVIHVFSREDRRFYDLERIWREGKHLESSEFLS